MKQVLGHFPYKSWPIYAWYDLRKGLHAPAKVSFKAQDSLTNSLRLVPTKFQFLGSNDPVCNDPVCNAASNWTVLCQNVERKLHCDVDKKRAKSMKFRCFGIKFLMGFCKDPDKCKCDDCRMALMDVRIWVWLDRFEPKYISTP